MKRSRFIVGIDLGTTHCALAYADSTLPDPAVLALPIPQIVAPGTFESRPTLPSCLYLAAPAEFPAQALTLPWDPPKRQSVVGEFARHHGAATPMRLVSSAKSWLCHNGIDRTSPTLPFQSPEEVGKVSPVAASAAYLNHLAGVWSAAFPEAPLAKQDLYLTVPASFDAVARELTVQAAAEAGLPHVTLIEEPQAAFYAWLDASGDAWRKCLRVGDVVLVCDIGGGTTDFSLITVRDSAGQFELERIAVGDHILLGGDNMDLAIAALVAGRIAETGGMRLDAWQNRALALACRSAKEALLGEEARESVPVTVLGRGRSIVGGTVQAELGRVDVARLLLDGFFPLCGKGEAPQVRRRTGLVELGLPFAADVAVTRHLGRFLTEHGASPTAVLFNGGVMKSRALRERVVAALEGWSGARTQLVEGTNYDLAVAQGAAYYGLVRRGQGIRIRGGTARAYYIGIASSLPAVPGLEPPIKAICVAPKGMEEGTELDLPGEELGLVVGEPAEFRFLSSTTRSDSIGSQCDELLDETAPLEVALPPSESAKAGELVPVHLRTRVTEVGTLELWCVARDGARWKLEYDLRGEK